MANINIPDSALFQAGAGPDLKLTHDGTNSTISNATGTLNINNIANSSMILGTNNTTALTITNGQVATFAGHVTMADSKELRLGNNADLLLYHNGSNSYLDHYNTGELYIRNRRTSGDILVATRAANGDNVPCVTFNSAGNSTFGEDINLAVGKLVNFGDTSGTTDRMLIRKNDDSSGEINVLSSNDLILRTADTTRLTIKANGDTQFGDSNGTGDIYHYGAYKFLINDVASSAAAPTYSFNSDPDTGMYRSGTDEIGFATSGAHRVSIEDDGIVQISQNDAGDGVLRINGTGANDTNIELQNDSALKWRIRNKGNESDRIEIRDAGSDDGVIMAQGATAFSSGSDERLKCNWTSFDNALSDINSLTKVGTFQYKNFGEDEPRNDKVHSGLSAQEVQKFLPSAVDANEEGEKFLYLRYQELIPVLVKAVQELSAEVKALKNG